MRLIQMKVPFFVVALIFLFVLVFVLWPNILTIDIGNKMNLAFFQNVKIIHRF